MEPMKVFKVPNSHCNIEICCLTCLDVSENPIKTLPCTFKHLNTSENAFLDHLGMEGQNASRGFMLLTHLLLPKDISFFVHIELMSHVTFPFHSITCVVPP